MPVLHNSLTGADLHEPKGVGGAASGSVYQANGGGSGSWVRPVYSVGPVALDVSKVGESVLIPFPASGRITQLMVVLGDEVTASGSTVAVALRTAAGITLGTATFTVDTSARGTTVIVPLDASVPAGSFLEAIVAVGSTDPVWSYLSITVEKT